MSGSVLLLVLCLSERAALINTHSLFTAVVLMFMLNSHCGGSRSNEGF